MHSYLTTWLALAFLFKSRLWTGKDFGEQTCQVQRVLFKLAYSFIISFQGIHAVVWWTQGMWKKLARRVPAEDGEDEKWNGKEVKHGQVVSWNIESTYINLPETNELHLKMDGWKMKFFLGWSILRGELLVSGSVRFIQCPICPVEYYVEYDCHHRAYRTSKTPWLMHFIHFLNFVVQQKHVRNIIHIYICIYFLMRIDVYIYIMYILY